MPNTETQPQVSFYNEDNTTEITRWDIGEVNAGQESESKTILIWNNRGGATDRSHMEDTEITSLAGSSNFASHELVNDRWLYIRVDSMDEISPTAVGGESYKKAVAARGVGNGIVQGFANSGALDDAANYAKITKYVQPRQYASAGQHDFVVRVSYTFV